MCNTVMIIDENRLEELTAFGYVNEEIRHCHGCNYLYTEDNWVEAKHDFDYVCQECGSNYKDSTLIRTIIKRTKQ